MKKILFRIMMYFKAKSVWKAKMSEKLKINIISIPKN